VARTANVDRNFVWSTRVSRGTVQFWVDRDHPLIREALEEAGPGRPALERALRIIEETLPVQSIVMESRDHPDHDRAPFNDRQKELAGILRRAYDALVSHGAVSQDALARLAGMEPFAAHPELIAALDEEVGG
jgi:hypothetical protein